MAAAPAPQPAVFGSPALDQAVAGVTAGIVSTFALQPLDLLKVQLQVSTAPKTRGTLGNISWGLREIVRTGGARALYRGLTPNLVGNASSWGSYFLWYTMLKARMDGGKDHKLSAGQHLLASATSGVITAVLTNPIWVVKTRMFTTQAGQDKAYRGVTHGLATLAREEGLRGMAKGLTLAIVGVSNGAIQFMAYEEMKKRRVELRRKRLGAGASDEEVKTLSNLEYILMSGSAKLVAIAITYPYQVVRSRIQYQPALSALPLGSTVPSPLASASSRTAPLPPPPTTPSSSSSSSLPSSSSPSSTPRAPAPTPAPAPPQPYRSIPDVLLRTYRAEGAAGFYKGIATNAVRILPGTCVTFVVYEQTSRFLSRWAGRRAGAREREREGQGERDGRSEG
ncbi:putative flavin-adenine dinucleotide transporter [Rhodotorula diobovata]|uniref:Putative flavin-adenine dinucleotide transporter n=1 Tax=Rhodotorula diobovata TaxID=5288 RepID=A0A5C5FPH4_9BASI|nr:putative flavin-adenine dinucleotide transporter [Rhodotorula diobovata]